ncbi:hypothetical protein ACSFBF_06855 [Variovorax sp. ZT5P49]|uniref:hypothetical protein n=1 Tax=Variovorax sp. ZT5P49 TaxID=3443733 RepID=UPI003F47D8A5
MSRVIDLKLPLTWLLGVAFAIVAGGFGLYHQIGSQGETLKDMKDQIKDLKITVNAGNSQAMTLAGEIAILKFRIENLESDRKAMR